MVTVLVFTINEAGADVIVNPLPTILANGTQMMQLFTNLLSNAIKFHGSEPPRIEVSARRKNGEHIITVKDNGGGIDPN